MTRIRVCSFKSLVVCSGIVILVLIARRNSLWKNLPSTKERSTFYQELAPQLSHSQSTPIFYDIKSGFVIALRQGALLPVENWIFYTLTKFTRLELLGRL